MLLTTLRKVLPEDATLRIDQIWSMTCSRKKIYDNNEEHLHKTVCDIAGGVHREDVNLLYMKADPKANVMFIQNDFHIDKDIAFRQGYEITSVIDLTEEYRLINNDDLVMFVAKLAPTQRDAETGKKHISISDAENRKIWVKRRFAKSGAEILQLQESGEEHIKWSHTKRQINQGRGWVNSYIYRGVARVTDAQQLIAGVRKGIGRNKAYGCGLIVLKKKEN